LDDALQAIEAGADALGFVFYEPSPRYIEPDKAREIISLLPPFVAIVGLFVNADQSYVDRVAKLTSLSVIQFHGDEDESFCSGFDLPYLKAIRVQSSQDIIDADVEFQSAQGILLDAYKKGVPGGTGESFDWTLIPKNIEKPLILAGGLNASNVGEAVRQLNPYGVDVSGGVELRKGVKDHAKVISFIKEVSRVSEY
jgi:phosphoribosylanthranilate isomerase